MPVADDAALVRLAQAGDMAAFSRLVDRYRARVYTVALRLLGDAASAEDASSDAFVRAYDALARFDPARPFGPWVVTIVARLCMDVVRRRRVREVSLDDRAAGGSYEPGAPGITPEQAAVGAAISDQVRQAITALPTRERIAVVLRHLEDMGYEEIARTMGVPVGTAKTLAYQGRRKLAAALRELGEECSQ